MFSGIKIMYISRYNVIVYSYNTMMVKDLFRTKMLPGHLFFTRTSLFKGKFLEKVTILRIFLEFRH